MVRNKCCNLGFLVVFSGRIFKIYKRLTKLNFAVNLSLILVNFCSNPVQPQNEYVEQSRKRRGYRLDHFEKK